MKIVVIRSPKVLSGIFRAIFRIRKEEQWRYYDLKEKMKKYKEKLKKTVKKYYAVVLVTAAYILVSNALGIVICPFRRLTGLPCPACGITRAYICAFHLDFKSAFAYNPFFLVLPPLMFYFLLGEKPLFGSKKREKYISIIMLATLLIFNSIRIYRILSY